MRDEADIRRPVVSLLKYLSAVKLPRSISGPSTGAELLKYSGRTTHVHTGSKRRVFQVAVIVNTIILTSWDALFRYFGWRQI